MRSIPDPARPKPDGSAMAGKLIIFFLCLRHAKSWLRGASRRSEKEEEAGPKPRLCGQSKAANCAAAALRSSEWPGLSTGRSKGFQASPTICA